MFIKPAPGLKIRDPHTFEPLPAAGLEVADDDLYWTRRLADGDVVLAPQNVEDDTKVILAAHVSKEWTR